LRPFIGQRVLEEKKRRALGGGTEKPLEPLGPGGGGTPPSRNLRKDDKKEKNVKKEMEKTPLSGSSGAP